jgi:hypothetical protein
LRKKLERFLVRQLLNTNGVDGNATVHTPATRVGNECKSLI